MREGGVRVTCSDKIPKHGVGNAVDDERGMAGEVFRDEWVVGEKPSRVQRNRARGSPEGRRGRGECSVSFLRSKDVR